MIFNQIEHLVKMTNGLYSNSTFSQDGQWSLIKCDMIYYPMHLPFTYHPPIYLANHLPTYYFPSYLPTCLPTYLYITYIRWKHTRVKQKWHIMTVHF